MKNVHKLTEGAIILAIYSVLLLLSLYIPFIGVVTNLFLALPFMLFAAKNDTKSSVVFLIASLFISMILGTILALPLTLAFGLTGSIMGYLIREKKGRNAIFLAGSFMFLVNIVLQYAVSVAFFHFNFIEELLVIIRESMDQSFSMLKSMGQAEGTAKIKEQFENGIKLIETLMPSLFLMSSFIIVFFIQLVSIPIIKRFGVKVDGWARVRDISLPKSFLWYYLITLLATLLLQPEEGTYWYWALTNLSYILQLFMVFQGLTFIFYFCDKKGLPKALPIMAVILSFLIPFFLYIVRILGIIDLGFDLRNRPERKVEK